MKREKALIITFVSILFLVLTFYGIKQVMITLGKDELIMTDNWIYFEPKEEKNLFDKLENKFNSLKNSLENRTNNYFPLYIELNSLYQDINYKTNSLVYNNVPLRTNTDKEYLFYNKQNNFYYLENQYSKKELDNRLNEQIKFFNNLSKQGIDISIYIPTRYELTTIKENNLNDYIITFEKELNKDIKVKYMQVNSVEEYKNYFYLTDHHWNINGALSGYNDIMDMLNASKITNIKTKTIKDNKYYGSLAKTAMNTKVNDYIMDIDLDLNYEVIVNDSKKPDLFKPRKMVMGKSNIYYDYYVQYFNGQYGNVIYDYNQEDKENLLILCDSYAWQIDYLIAASFNKTHVINLRYDKYQKEALNLKEYMKKNNISKVLFLYEGGSTLFDQYNYNMIGKVK